MQQLVDGLYFVKTQKKLSNWNGIACVRDSRIHIFNYLTMSVVIIDEDLEQTIVWGKKISPL